MPISRTASAMHSGIDDVYDEPGLQSVASATVTPAPSSRRASGHGERVENSTPGSSVATTPVRASASTSSSDRYVQWSADAVPSSHASCTPGPWPSWLAWIRGSRPAAAAGRQNRAGLVGVEGAALAERVDPARVRRACLEHRPAHERDVGRRVVGQLGWHHVRAQEGRLRGQRPRDRQRPCLVGDREPVAALDLDGRRALAQHLRHQRPGPGRQLLVGRRSGRLDRRTDATGGVRAARHPGLELRAAVAGEDQVGVRVDEAGHHRAPADVHRRVGRRRPQPPDPPRPPARPRRRGRRR